MSQEQAEGADQTSSNDMGIYNSWYENGGYDKWYAGREDWLTFTDEPYQETEFEDFELFLDVCQETGVQPLVVLMPLKVPWLIRPITPLTCGPSGTTA